MGLAEAARKAKVPVHFLGKPLTERDPYFKRFVDLVQTKQATREGGPFLPKDLSNFSQSPAASTCLRTHG